MDPCIEQLLKLQDSDTLKLQNEQRLKIIPREIEKIKEKIQEETQGIEDARTELKQSEVKRNEMRTERRGLEEQIVKYKTQQLEVKKNEEFQALTHEIETTTERIGNIEDEEIALLMSIDDLSAGFAEREKEGQDRIALLQKEIEQQEERLQFLKADTEKMENEVAERSREVDPIYLKAYDNVKRRFKKPPFVVPIIDHKVNGLRVSNDVEGKARKADCLVIDEGTGRIVYWPDAG